MTDRRHPRGVRSGRVLAAALFLGACGGGQAPAPEPGQARGAVPDLRGSKVMVFPAQNVMGVQGEPDAELGFALEQRGPAVEWIFPDELRRAIRSSPGMDIRVEGLPVGMFLRAEVRRIGDPLFGNLLRLSALTGGEVALIPVAVSHRPETAEAPGAVEVAAALIAVRNGRVLWYGVVEGDPGAGDDPAAVASALDALGRKILPWSGS